MSSRSRRPSSGSGTSGWGHDAESHLGLTNILSSPLFVLEGLAASLESLLGLADPPLEGVAKVGWGSPCWSPSSAWSSTGKRGGRASRAASGSSPRATATNWFLAAFNYIPGREPTTGRYMYAGGVFVLLLAAELLRDVRFGRRALLVCGAIALAAVATNLVILRDGGRWLGKPDRPDQGRPGRDRDLAAQRLTPTSPSPPKWRGRPR